MKTGENFAEASAAIHAAEALVPKDWEKYVREVWEKEVKALQKKVEGREQQ